MGTCYGPGGIQVWNPLHFAAYYGHVEVLDYLLSCHGVCIDSTVPPSTYALGETALHLACLNDDQVAVVRLLLERGADPSIIDQAGLTPLMKAAGKGNIRVVDVFLKHDWARRTINRKTGAGTALYFACHAAVVGKERADMAALEGVVRILLKAGADPTITGVGGTPLQLVRREGLTQFIKILEVSNSVNSIIITLSITCQSVPSS